MDVQQWFGIILVQDWPATQELSEIKCVQEDVWRNNDLPNDIIATMT
jgi:hypothetical protein